MLPLGILDQCYVVSSGVGLIYLSVTLMMGRIGRGGHSHGGHGLGHSAGAGHGIGHAGGIGHGGGHAAGLGHAGGHAAGHGIGHAGGHAAGIGHAGGNGAGHGSAGHGPAHTGAAGAGHGGVSSDTGSGAGQGNILDTTLLSTQVARQSASLHIHVPGEGVEGFLGTLLEILNPMLIAVFMCFFGISGLTIHTLLPALGLITLAPAALCGFFSARAFAAALHWMFDHLEISSEAKVEDMVGLAANVSVPISNNRPGEITYVIESKRLNSPAKSLTPNVDFAKGSKVMICEVRDNIAFVEPWKELYEPIV